MILIGVNVLSNFLIATQITLVIEITVNALGQLTAIITLVIVIEIELGGIRRA